MPRLCPVRRPTWSGGAGGLPQRPRDYARGDCRVYALVCGFGGVSHATGELCLHWGRVGRLSFCFASAASAPRRPSHAGAGDASRKVLTKTVMFGGCSPPHLMWGM